MSHEFRYDYEGYVEVYTDGACLSNGRNGPKKAGIGVWFNDNSPYNVSKPVVGRATNNNAEIQAVTEAANQAISAGITHLKIFTDSQFVINCATKWIHTWKYNGWRRDNGDHVINKPELIDMDNALARLTSSRFVHVRGHQGTHGNIMADQLARAGCEQYCEYY